MQKVLAGFANEVFVRLVLLATVVLLPCGWLGPLTQPKASNRPASMRIDKYWRIGIPRWTISC